MYTVQQSDLNVISPIANIGLIAPLVWLAGKFDATAGTISYRLLRNGVSLATGTTASITANYYYTLNIVNTNWTLPTNDSLKAGDVIEVRLWCSQPNTTLLYSAIGFYPSRLRLSNSPVVKDVYWLGNASPVPTQGITPSLAGDAFYVYTGQYYTTTRGTGVFSNYVMGNILWYDNNNSDRYSPYFIAEKTYGLGAIMFGDAGYLTTVNLKTHATNYPYYERSVVPKTITFREVRLDR
jgi:hypothetical protein